MCKDIFIIDPNKMTIKILRTRSYLSFRKLIFQNLIIVIPSFTILNSRKKDRNRLSLELISSPISRLNEIFISK